MKKTVRVAETITSAERAEKRRPVHARSEYKRVLEYLSLYSLLFGRVPKNPAPFLRTRPNISESHSEISTRVPVCIAVRPPPRTRTPPRGPAVAALPRCSSAGAPLGC